MSPPQWVLGLLWIWTTEHTIAYHYVMDSLTHSDDPLEREIAALEVAIINDNGDIAELEEILAQKRRNVQMLTVEVRVLKRAASLRPIVRAAEVQAPVPPPEAAPAAGSRTGRFKNLVAQIRTSDPRLPAYTGG